MNFTNNYFLITDVLCEEAIRQCGDLRYTIYDTILIPLNDSDF